jgi:hypothetical protein
MFSRENTKLVVVAAVCLTTALVAPATAAVYDAVNADKVDGKHAVGAGSTVSQRKGKLVATSGKTGRLPNNIIAKAPNADKLDGVDSAAMRFIDIDLMGANTYTATKYTAYPFYGIELPDNGTATIGQGFVIPPDFRGKTMKMHILWRTNETGCSVAFSVDGVTVTHVGRNFNYNPESTAAGMTGPATTPAAPTLNYTTETVYTLSSPDPQKSLQPLDQFGFQFHRVTDTCQLTATVSGIYITY